MVPWDHFLHCQSNIDTAPNIEMIYHRTDLDLHFCLLQMGSHHWTKIEKVEFELSKICSPSQGNTGVIIECWNALILPQINDILINNDMIHHLGSFNEAMEQQTVMGMKLVAEAIGSGINRMPFLKFETVPEEDPAETIDESESE